MSRFRQLRSPVSLEQLKDLVLIVYWWASVVLILFVLELFYLMRFEEFLTDFGLCCPCCVEVLTTFGE